mgnify:CR=1 FL=1
MDVMYCTFPYEKHDLYAVRHNDDGTWSMRTWIGTFDDIYPAQKRRFDLRQSKPYITTHDYKDVERIINGIRAYNIGNDLQSIGFNYSWFDGQISANWEFVQAGCDKRALVVIVKRHRSADDIQDCKVSIVR